MLLKKDWHYMGLMLGVVIMLSVAIMYLLPYMGVAMEETRLLDVVSAIVPSARELRQQISNPADPKVLLIATMWCLAPFAAAAGYVSSFFLSEERHRVLIHDIRWWRLITIFLIFFGCCVSAAFIPMTSVGFPFGAYMDQASNFFPKLVWSWATTLGVFYVLGQVIGVMRQKFSKNTRPA